MKLSHIVAVDHDWCIGKDDQLLFKIKSDLKHFKKLTTNGVVIMGRKTYESIGRPLPNRRNIVITSNPESIGNKEGAAIASNIDDAVLKARILAHEKTDEVFIIGGGKIYRQPFGIIDKIYLTVIDSSNNKGNIFYPKIGDFSMAHSGVLELTQYGWITTRLRAFPVGDDEPKATLVELERSMPYVR